MSPLLSSWLRTPLPRPSPHRPNPHLARTPVKAGPVSTGDSALHSHLRSGWRTAGSTHAPAARGSLDATVRYEPTKPIRVLICIRFDCNTHSVVCKWIFIRIGACVVTVTWSGVPRCCGNREEEQQQREMQEEKSVSVFEREGKKTIFTQCLFT